MSKTLLENIEESMDRERNDRSMELFNKPYAVLELGEVMMLNKYIDDLQHPQWKPIMIDGVESKYRVSNTGRVMNAVTNKELSTPCKFPGDYRRVTICVDGKTYGKLVHSLVADAFIEKPDNMDPKDLVVNHKTGVKSCPWYGNLEWVTRSENAKHAIASGLMRVKYGADNGATVYSEETVRKVCKLLEQWKHPKEISDLLGVPKSLPQGIKCGESWQHIAKDYKIPATGEVPHGPKKHPQKSKIYTPEVINETCRLLESGMTNSEVASALGVKSDFVSDVRGRRIWVHYSKNYNIPYPKKTPNKGFRKTDRLHDRAKAMIASGIVSNNELLAKLGLPDTPDNRKYLNRLRSRTIHQPSTTIDQPAETALAAAAGQ